MHPYIAEFIGTFLLMLVGIGVNANMLLTKTKGNRPDWLLMSAGWGFSVFLAVATVGQYSGAHINPAVTFGLWVAGKFPFVDVIPFIICQFAGAILGAMFAFLAYYKHYQEEENPATILGTFSTAPEIRSYGWNMMTEAIGTFVLVFVVLYLSDGSAMIAGEETPIGLGSVGAIPVGLLVFGIGIGLGGPTGYAINPARDLGPRITHAFLPIKNKGGGDWAYAPVPVVAPLIGAAAAAVLFWVVGS